MQELRTNTQGGPPCSGLKGSNELHPHSFSFDAGKPGGAAGCGEVFEEGATKVERGAEQCHLGRVCNQQPETAGAVAIMRLQLTGLFLGPFSAPAWR